MKDRKTLLSGRTLAKTLVALFVAFTPCFLVILLGVVGFVRADG